MSAAFSADSPVNGETAVFGILGHPVGHSLSPLLHNAAMRFRRFNGVYVPFDVEKPDKSLKKALIALGIKGLSVTIPHKGWAAAAADEADALSRHCGAANTLVLKEEKLIAYNTDGPGAVRALKEKAGTVSGKRVLILGYGGSAAGIAHALLLNEKPREILIAGRNKSKRRKFARELTEAHGGATQIRDVDVEKHDPESVDFIINTTPLGMKGQSAELPIPDAFLKERHIVFDIVYNPPRTPLLQAAQRRGAKTIPGYLMLLYQAALQFELFTGMRA
ncbi:MAG: shikimate dehydrogenase, partial [Spirochaetia bacterium]|nr:shikimate dehydrogenase [Spirochaetia bacterium]